MNEPGSPIPPPLPSSAGGNVDLREPGPTAADLVPIHGLGGVLDALLRRPRGLSHHLSGADAPRLIGLMLLLAVAGSGLYGVVVGTFSGGTQLWAAPAKITGGLLVCGIICLPSLYVMACLTGATARFADVAGMVAGLLALTTLLLFSFAPVAWVFSQSPGRSPGWARCTSCSGSSRPVSARGSCTAAWPGSGPGARARSLSGWSSSSWSCCR